MASRSVQPFCRAHDRDRPTDRRRYSVSNNKPHLASTVMRPKNWPSVGLLSHRQMTARVAAMRGTNTWRDRSHNVTSSMSSAVSSRHCHCSAAQPCRCVAVMTRRCRRTSERQVTMSVGLEASPSRDADCRNDSGHCTNSLSTSFHLAATTSV